MERTKETAPTEEVGRTIDGGHESIVETLAEVSVTPARRPGLQIPDKQIAVPWSLKHPGSVRREEE
jgi:hypothetical protein